METNNDTEVITKILKIICLIFVAISILSFLSFISNIGDDLIIHLFQIFFGRSLFIFLYPYVFGGVAGLVLLFYKNWKLKIIGFLGILIAIFVIVTAYNQLN